MSREGRRLSIRNGLCVRQVFLSAVTVLAVSLARGPSALAQVTVEDYSRLIITEILADNVSVLPHNCRCHYVDLIELFNSGDKLLPLDHPELGYVRITDESDDASGALRYLRFDDLTVPVRNLAAGQRLVVFADNAESCSGPRDCLVLHDTSGEVHAPFALSNDGETLRLEFVPDANPFAPIVLDRVTFPALPEDTSWARFPDTPESDVWVFADEPTFGGRCLSEPAGELGPVCVGAPNDTGAPLPPEVELIDYQGIAPAAGEPLSFRVRIIDEKAPVAENFESVLLRYRVDGEAVWQEAPMSFLGLFNTPAVPSDRWSVWEGSVPGQEAGSVVEFYFVARDVDSLEDSDPSGPICDPCGDGIGVICQPTGCDLPFRYTVGPAASSPLVINEVVANNESILADLTETHICAIDNPMCHFDDFIEIHNASDTEVALSGLVVARGAFRPYRGWRFPTGSRIGPREYVLVWIDADADDNPDPNDPASQEFHADFNLDASRDEVLLFDRRDANYALIDSVRWGIASRYVEGSSVLEPLPLADSAGIRDPLAEDESLARMPDGSRASALLLLPGAEATPRAANGGTPVEVEFRRGDANGDGALDTTDAIGILGFLFLGSGDPGCLDALDSDDSGLVELTDAVGLLSYLFAGGAPLPAPGGETCGADTTADSLAACAYPGCE